MRFVGFIRPEGRFISAAVEHIAAVHDRFIDGKNVVTLQIGNDEYEINNTRAEAIDKLESITDNETTED